VGTGNRWSSHERFPPALETPNVGPYFSFLLRLFGSSGGRSDSGHAAEGRETGDPLIKLPKLTIHLYGEGRSFESQHSSYHGRDLDLLPPF
jgi:hypothetical protein